MLIKQKATPYTKLIREWLSYPPAFSASKIFSSCTSARASSLLPPSSPSPLPPPRGPHLSPTTSAHGPHSYTNFFSLLFNFAYFIQLPLSLSSQHHYLFFPLPLILQLAVFETLRTTVLLFIDDGNAHGKQISVDKNAKRRERRKDSC